jgi:hypothetical protein
MLFTMDANSMYTNIHLNHALPIFKTFFTENLLGKRIIKSKNIPLSAFLTGLSIVMDHNIIKFGDTFWLQKAGTAMGPPPAPCYAILYYFIHEQKIIPEFPELVLYRRYIDDGFGIWAPVTSPEADRECWRLFKHRVQEFGIEHQFFSENPHISPLT